MPTDLTVLFWNVNRLKNNSEAGVKQRVMEWASRFDVNLILFAEHQVGFADRLAGALNWNVVTRLSGSHRITLLSCLKIEEINLTHNY